MSHYSLTKYMNGHSDVIMGSVATNNDELASRIKFLQVCSCRSTVGCNIIFIAKIKFLSNVVKMGFREPSGFLKTRQVFCKIFEKVSLKFNIL